MSEPETSPPRLLLICPHADRVVPDELRSLFTDAEHALDSPLGWNPGAAQLAEAVARRCRAPLVSHPISRLVIEVDRSLDRRRLFSEWTLRLDEYGRNRVIESYYHPFRDQIAAEIQGSVFRDESVLLVSIHSFAAEVDRKVRRADVGLLYDTGRPAEVERVDHLQDALRELRPKLRVRRNYPVSGKADGLLSTLRERFSADRLSAVTITFNQRFVGQREWQELREALADALAAELTSSPPNA